MEKESRLRRVLNMLNHSIFGRTVGSLSCVVGLICYALSSSFKSLFGEWNPTKIVFYIILSSMIIVVVLFEAKSRVSVVSKLKPHVEFLVLMLTSLYSFFADRSTKGKPDTWSVVSSVAFALTSLSVFIAANQAWVRFVLGSYSESQSENGDSSAEESVVIRIDDDDANRMTAGFRYPLLVFWSYFEKWLRRPKVAATEQFLWDLQERERRQPQQQQQPLWEQQWEEQWELQCKQQWEQQWEKLVRF
ncbi:hypothetical protein K1719_039768 [Acacia pycnantha]|nr:hypothetical protein K1719_039768 [Acacia pycnantha]